MKQTRLLMGMPITIEIADKDISPTLFEKVFSYFESVDKRFSTYKEDSEISKINRGEIDENEYSADMRTIFQLAEETKQQTRGYFDIVYKNTIDPSGIVKGWAIYQAAHLLSKEGVRNYYVEAGGDIQVNGKNENGEKWHVGIRNPFNSEEIVKVVYLKDEGIATSGTYIRGQHIYNPHKTDEEISDIMSITVIGPNIYEADRFATAAFAMGKMGISFIESLRGFEGYMIDSQGVATYTSHFEQYTKNI